VLGALALLLATIRRRPGASLALTLVALWVVLHITVVHGQMRYMLAVTPLLAPALGWLLTSTWTSSRNLVRERGFRSDR
jgi:uncharacterized membrane protein YjdF